MEKTGWTDRVKNKEAIQKVKEKRNILQKEEGRKANCIDHIL